MKHSTIAGWAARTKYYYLLDTLVKFSLIDHGELYRAKKHIYDDTLKTDGE